MAAKPDSLNHRGAYIPASAQKSITQHMDRTMPSHLKKYQQGGYIPKHAEKAMSQHLQKTLPDRLKKHADPYLQQNVMRGNNTKSSVKPEASPTYSPVKPAASSNSLDRQLFSSDDQQNTEAPSSPSDGEQGYQQPAAPPPPGDNDYDFIMNSPNSGGPSFLAPQSTKMRIAIFSIGVIVLIVLMIVFFSFLNSAGNKQKENLLAVAKTQQEIIRLIDENEQSISSNSLKDKTQTLRVVMITSQQEGTAALAARGKQASPKELESGINPQNDADLETAFAQARGDEALDEILKNLLDQYAAQLQVVFNEGNQSEKEFATDAFNQVSLLYDLGQDTGQEEEQSQATQ